MTDDPATTPVRVERDGDLAVVVLDHPPLNLFDESVFAGFEKAIAELAGITAPGQPGRARAVLFEARGRVVSGGVDVHAFQEIAEGPDPVGQGTALWSRLMRLAQGIEDLPVPTVFAAHGLTLTAAFELSLACDLLLATESASFGLVEIVVGLTPSMGGPQRLAERAGPARAKELVLTGERFPAEVLRGWGVVNRVLPRDGFADAARTFARTLAAGPDDGARDDQAARRHRRPGGRSRGRRDHAADVRGPVRHRGPAGRRRLVPDRRPGTGYLPGPLIPGAARAVLPGPDRGTAVTRCGRIGSIIDVCAGDAAGNGARSVIDLRCPVVDRMGVGDR